MSDLSAQITPKVIKITPKKGHLGLTFPILCAIILVLKKLDKGYQGLKRKVHQMNTNNYYNEIRNDIAKDFGLEAAGYAPQPKLLPIRIAQRITAKYPSTWVEGERRPILNPKAVLIAKRYMSLFVA